MRLVSAQTVLLLATLLSLLSRSTLATPTNPSLLTENQWLSRRGNDTSIGSIDRTEGLETSSRDEETLYSTWANKVAELDIRAFFPKINPRPPTPPPLPVPGGSSGALGARPGVVPRPVPHPGAPAPHPQVNVPGKPVVRPEPPPRKPDWQPIPDNVNPNSGTGKGGSPRPMQVYQSLGQQQFSDYETVVSSRQLDTLIVPTAAELAEHQANRAFLDYDKNAHYRALKDKSVGKVKELQNFMESELGFDPMAVQTVERRVVTNSDTGETINGGVYDKYGKFVVFQDAFKEENTVPNSIPLNEIGMQSFIKVAGENTKNFKVGIFANIVNKEFWAITRSNYNDAGQPFEQVLTFEHGSPGFDQFMGSPNIRSKFYAFGNHHNAIGSKVPDRIIVIPKQAQDTRGDGQLDVAVVFKALES
nr:hypothetical protein CFP56_26021 [Quercus suber]